MPERRLEKIKFILPGRLFRSYLSDGNRYSHVFHVPRRTVVFERVRKTKRFSDRRSLTARAVVSIGTARDTRNYAITLLRRRFRTIPLTAAAAAAVL